jgi:hypothetical protein
MICLDTRNYFKYLYLLRPSLWDILWRKFHGLLRRIWVLQLLNVILYICSLSAIELWCSLTLKFLCWLFSSGWSIFLWEWSIKSHPLFTITGTICSFMSGSVYFMKLGIPVFAPYVHNNYFFLVDCFTY